MMEYTKGPWTWNEDEAAVVAGTPEKGKIICYPEKYSKKEFYGNKNLIAAAPEMYEALKAIGQCCLVTEYSAEERIRLVEQSVNVALGKAEGRL